VSRWPRVILRAWVSWLIAYFVLGGVCGWLLEQVWPWRGWSFTAVRIGVALCVAAACFKGFDWAERAERGGRL